MAVDVTPLVGRLRRSLSAPGADQFPDTMASEWMDRVADAFWYAKLNGYFPGYTIDTTSRPYMIESTTAVDLEDDALYVVVLYAAIVAIEASLTWMNTSTKYKAGPAEADTAKSALVLRQLLQAKIAELETLRQDIVLGGGATSVGFIDLVEARAESLLYDESYWIR